MPRDKKIILFIHGLSGSSATWGKFPTLIASEPKLSCYDVHFYEYPSPLIRWLPWVGKAPKIQTLAGGLKTKINNLLADHPAEVTLICHSLGGLVARYYILEEIKAKRPVPVTSLILLAVPNNGSELAEIGKLLSWDHKQLKQLCEDSDFLNMLNNDWVTFEVSKKIRLKYVIAAQDQVVTAESATQMWGHPNCDFVVDKGHKDLVKPTDAKDEVYRIVRRFLLDDVKNLSLLNALCGDSSQKESQTLINGHGLDKIKYVPSQSERNTDEYIADELIQLSKRPLLAEYPGRDVMGALFPNIYVDPIVRPRKFKALPTTLSSWLEEKYSPSKRILIFSYISLLVFSKIEITL